MKLPPFQYHDPPDLEAACRLMAEFKEGARPLAGGTDLLVAMRREGKAPDAVVSLRHLDALRRIEAHDGQIRLGACVTAAQAADSAEIAAAYRAVAQAAGRLGSPLIRNRATVGGNLVTARPAADLPLPLMACGARVVLRGGQGQRTVALEDFFLAPGETVRQADEVLTHVVLQKPPARFGSSYLKLGARKTLVIALVNAAAALQLDGAANIAAVRIVLGAVGPTPIRARKAEELLLGQAPSEALFIRAGAAAAAESRPIDDFRGSAEYRRAMVAVLTRRTLAEASAEAQAVSGAAEPGGREGGGVS